MRIDLTTTSAEQASPADHRSASDNELRDARRNQIIAFAILALLVAGGIGWGWWKWKASQPPNERLVDVPMDRSGFQLFRQGNPGDAAQPAGSRAPAPPPVDGVRKIGVAYRVRAGQATMVTSQGRQNDWRTTFGYDPPRSTPQQEQVILVRSNPQRLGLTPEQVKQLEALGPFTPGMVVSDADKQKMDALWKTYVGASDDAARGPAEKALVAALADLGQRCDEPSRAAIQARVDKIKAVLTPEQLAKLPR